MLLNLISHENLFLTKTDFILNVTKTEFLPEPKCHQKLYFGQKKSHINKKNHKTCQII